MTRDEPRTGITPSGGGWAGRLTELWAYRELLYFFVWKDVKVRYKQTLIGAAWVVLQPLSAMLLFTCFFGYIIRLPSEGLPYPLFYFCGLLPWVYFAHSVYVSSNSLADNESLVSKVYFPRLFLPMAAVSAGVVDFSVAFAVLVVFTLAYGYSPSAASLALPLFFALAVLAAFAIGLWTCALNALYRDVRYAVNFLVQLWMFASPVVYPASAVPEHWRPLYALNPMTGVVEGFRWGLTGAGGPPGLMLGISATATVAILFGGLWFFYKTEGVLADHI